MVMPNDPLISIVDDQESARAATAGLIRSFGFAAATFGSAAGFLASGDLARTVCLVSDVRMPGMSGPKLHALLVATGTQIPTVLVTGCADQRVRDRALKAGVRGYLTKPLDPEDLLACIRSCIAGRSERSYP